MQELSAVIHTGSAQASIHRLTVFRFPLFFVSFIPLAESLACDAMPISLPPFFEQKLNTDQTLKAGVYGTIAEVGKWFHDSKLFFFPDYTNHGPEHVNEVLATSEALMTNASQELFSASDAAVLILSTLLHDSAMHLSAVGFDALIHGAFKDYRVAELDRETWPQLWSDFLFSARRWDDVKLGDVFGIRDDGSPRYTVRDPFSHWDDLSEGDRKLIGEFLRQHHARLAHLFARHGVPRVQETPIAVDASINQELRDISGLVARSHGLPVRTCLDYLAASYHRREYQGVHAVFLMAVLRVSDYLQVQSSRAPAIAFRYRHIPSRTSQIEWRAHNAITNITQTHDDPESIEIQAKPADVQTFLRLRDWLGGIQRELDASWSVLGEVYGLNPTLSRFGLRVRRVRSNLIDDVERFAASVAFVPDRIQFDVARPELLKLLIRPLYGDRPEIGVRELIQNAIDAVRERKIFERHRKLPRPTDRTKREPDVIVHLADADATGTARLTVADRGIGMTEEVVKDYFLRAGASFRQSDAWKGEFEVPHPEPGTRRSSVLRSGRFGVGALAAFLLGDEIHVVTRHVSSRAGLSFRTRLDAGNIEVTRDPDAPIGTSITVILDAEVVSRLDHSTWRVETAAGLDWYYFPEPSVSLRRGARGERIISKYHIHLPREGEASDWRKLPAQLPYDVYWTFGDAPALTVNGIFVNNSDTLLRLSEQLAQQGALSLQRPRIAVTDPDAAFPLNLQRTQLTFEPYPFDSALVEDVVRDIFSWLYNVTPPKNEPQSINNIGWYSGLTLSRYSVNVLFAATKTGLSFFSPSIFSDANFKHVVFLPIVDRPELLPDSIECDAALYYSGGGSPGVVEFNKDKSRIVWAQDGETWPLEGVRVTTAGLTTYETRGGVELELEQRIGGWTVYASANCPPSGFPVDHLPRRRRRSDPITLFVELYLQQPFRPSVAPSRLEHRFVEWIDHGAIPFDLQHRQRALRAAAGDELLQRAIARRAVR